MKKVFIIFYLDLYLKNLYLINSSNMTDHCNREYLQKSSNGDIQADPKSVQELTNFVQLTLQQMQDKFQSMSDQIINRNILF